MQYISDGSKLLGLNELPVDLLGSNISGTLPFDKGGRVNPELLINSDFRNPVNRNGKREYTQDGYTIDKWVMDNIEKVTLQDNFITVTTAASNNEYGKLFQQLIGKQFNNKTVTVSILYRNTSDQEASLALYNLSQNLWKSWCRVTYL